MKENSQDSLKAMQYAWSSIAKASNKKDKMEKFFRLCSLFFVDGLMHGVMRNKKKIIGDFGDPELTHVLAKSDNGSKVGSGLSVVVLALGNGIEMVLAGKNTLEDEAKNYCRKNAIDLGFNEKEMQPGWWITCVVLLVVALIPINDRIFVSCSVNGNLNTVISSPVVGVVTRINARYGEIKKGDTLAHIDSDIDFELKRAQLNIERLQLMIRNEGANPTKNIHGIQAELKTAVASEKFLAEQLLKETVVAGRSGVIEWSDDLLGKMVERGDPLGVIQQKKQNAIIADIPIKDWIPIKKGDKASFVVDGDYSKRFEGIVRNISPTVRETAQGAFYRVNIEINEQLNVGTSGTIGILGSKINFFWYFFRKPAAYILAITGL